MNNNEGRKIQSRVYKDLPLLELTMRKMEKPSNNYDEVLRKFCISVGLLQPGDSRDIIVSILKILLKARKYKKLVPTEVMNKLLKEKKGGTPPNIRRQLRRLKELGFVEKKTKGYRLREFMPLNELLSTHFEPFILKPTYERIKLYGKKLDELSEKN